MPAQKGKVCKSSLNLHIIKRGSYYVRCCCRIVPSLLFLSLDLVWMVNLTRRGPKIYLLRKLGGGVTFIRMIIRIHETFCSLGVTQTSNIFAAINLRSVDNKNDEVVRRIPTTS